MFEQIDTFRQKYNDVAYTVFRVLIGVLFMFHGAQKLFGILGMTSAAPITSLFGIAGIVELLGGLLIALGLFTVPAAIVTAIEMISAYFMAHFSKGPWPITNGGELAVLYLIAFFFIVFEGSGKYSLDKKICKK